MCNIIYQIFWLTNYRRLLIKWKNIVGIKVVSNFPYKQHTMLWKIVNIYNGDSMGTKQRYETCTYLYKKISIHEKIFSLKVERTLLTHLWTLLKKLYLLQKQILINFLKT